MKSLASLVLIAAAPAHAQEPPQGDGQRGSSQVTPGEERFDEVGYAAVDERARIAASVRGLTPGSYAEVTALDSGKTILVTIDGNAPDGRHIAALSVAAAAALGMKDGAPIRVRKVVAQPEDVAQLRQGAQPPTRIDAPPVLLAALRKRLPAAIPAEAARRPVAKAVPPPTAPRPAAKPGLASARQGSYWVQVASLANATNAKALAARIGGVAEPRGTLTRVRIGPLPDRAAADSARKRAVSLGYPDAQITRN